MKKYSINNLGWLLLGIAMMSCKKQESYQINPNSPSQATPALLLTDICVSQFNNYPPDPAYASRHLTYFERSNINVNYGWTTSVFGGYSLLLQVKTMDSLAKKDGNTSYEAVGKLMRAISFIAMTETFGDIPYSKAVSGVDFPDYDRQEDVYTGCLQELEEANTMLEAGKDNLQGDIIYGGKTLSWKKLTNAFRLRVLMHLSKKAGTSKIDIRGQFNQIVSNPSKYPLFVSEDENAQLKFNKDYKENAYPTFQNLSIGTLVALEKGLVDSMKVRKDPRLFKIAQPANGTPSAVPGAPQRFEDYKGVDAGKTVAAQANDAITASRLAKRYTENQENEPLIFMSYAEQEFLIAEGISMGWTSGDATAHYNNGITGSMQFYGISSAEIAGYLQQPAVVFKQTDAIRMIHVQKHLSFFMNSGWEPFMEQRRTGIPGFSTGTGTLNGGVIPKRWQYPQDEYDNNKQHVEASVKTQYDAGDNVNAVMWLLK